jgi:hypothetical protein
MNAKQINVEFFNNQPYKFNAAIYDADGNYMSLNAAAFQNLTIEDSIFIPFNIGTATIVNVNNALQSSSTPSAPALNFAGNNHDLLAIDIMPAVSKQGIDADSQDEFLCKTFNINSLFCINELQDSDEKSDRTSNTMNFRDAHHQVMLENASQITSVEALGNLGRLQGDVVDLNNSERAIETGELLKQLLEKTFNTPDVIDVDNFEIGYGKIMFASQASSNAFQDMMHINSLQLSEQNRDPCIIQFDRYTKKFSNIALSKYFELQNTNPETYLLETFVISDGQSGDGAKKPPSGPGIDIACNIIEYKLSPINGNEFTRKITNAVYNATASADRNHYVGMKENNLQTVLDTYKQLYVEPFKTIAPEAVPSIDFNKFINQEKKTLRPKIVNTTLPFKYEQLPRNSMFLDLIVSGGDNIVFRALGSTHRRSGRFIDITSKSQISDNKLANTLLGRWFIVKVTHVFSGNKYFNVIEAIKTYKTSE